MVFDSKLTVFAGLNGSGKTTIAVNAALFLGKQQEKTQFDRVLLADLDIVNPYFRSKDAEKALLDAGVTFISSEYAGSGLEAPSLPKAIEEIFTSSGQIIIDVGGDEAGSTVLGRYSKEILAVADRQFYLVFNPYRMLTQTVSDTKELLQGIEIVSRIPFTGIIYNPNLGSITTADDVHRKLPLAHDLAQSSNLPLTATCILRHLEPQLQDIEKLFCLDPVFDT
ncbi:MAG: hypothetical protein FWD47_10275 [Treponema sp.]|nr:hypothetical protein [Treponema sp.]